MISVGLPHWRRWKTSIFISKFIFTTSGSESCPLLLGEEHAGRTSVIRSLLTDDVIMRTLAEAHSAWDTTYADRRGNFVSSKMFLVHGAEDVVGKAICRTAGGISWGLSYCGGHSVEKDEWCEESKRAEHGARARAASPWS